MEVNNILIDSRLNCEYLRVCCDRLPLSQESETKQHPLSILLTENYLLYTCICKCRQNFDGDAKISIHTKGYQHKKVWFGLCCLMTPGPSKDIQCHVRPYFF